MLENQKNGRMTANIAERKSGNAHPAFDMMIPFIEQKAVDLTAFLGQWPTRLQVNASASDLSAMADRFNLEGMCVSHFASIFGFDTRSGNEALFAETAEDSRL